LDRANTKKLNSKEQERKRDTKIGSQNVIKGYKKHFEVSNFLFTIPAQGNQQANEIQNNASVLSAACSWTLALFSWAWMGATNAPTHIFKFNSCEFDTQFANSLQ